MILRLSHWLMMRDLVTKSLPEEACGLVAGRDNHSQQIFPISNQLHSPTRFYMDPIELLLALEEIDRQGLELLAIYHSHPTGPGFPSPRDLAENYYPGTYHLIWSPWVELDVPTGWQCLAYTLHSDRYTPVELVVEKSL
jgi:proteasome lid subunit RPN8/RPN11